MYTTINKIKAHKPAHCEWKKLLKFLNKTEPDDEPLKISDIVKSNSVDPIWVLYFVEGHDREIRLFAVWCARRAQHLMMSESSIKALDVAEQYANGKASDKELEIARQLARAAKNAVPLTEQPMAAQAAEWATQEIAKRTIFAAREAAWAIAVTTAEASKWTQARLIEFESQKQELLRICITIENQSNKQ